MSRTATLRRVFSLTCLCALLMVPRLHAADVPLSADFDGDGKRDRVTFSLQEPEIVRIWLSGSSTTHEIRSPEPLVALAAADLDGDRRAELIATHRRPGLRVWTRTHTTFRVLRPAENVPVTCLQSSDRAFDSGPSAPALAASDLRPPLPSLSISAHPGVPTLRGWQRAPALARGPTASPCFSPFGPRPPPSAI